MKSKLALIIVLFAVAAIAAPEGSNSVLGPCGSTGENEPAATAPQGGLQVARIPLPGDRATNFALPAVVGEEIKTVKLSDYNGKWRVVCFYPADFTFV
jgi:peroxiredoxin (alkyl hydroperoxide reductase subunit C)